VKPKLETVCAEVKDALLASPAAAEALCSVPVFAIWTPYRNLYAEMKTLNAKLERVDAKLDAIIKKVEVTYSGHQVSETCTPS
jgi:hypothetical protein